MTQIEISPNDRGHRLCNSSGGSFVKLEGDALAFLSEVKGRDQGLYTCLASFYHHKARVLLRVEVRSPEQQLGKHRPPNENTPPAWEQKTSNLIARHVFPAPRSNPRHRLRLLRLGRRRAARRLSVGVLVSWKRHSVTVPPLGR